MNNINLIVMQTPGSWDSLLNSLLALQLEPNRLPENLFSYANNLEHFTSECFLDRLSRSELKDFLDLLNEQLACFVAHEGLSNLLFNRECCVFSRLLYHLDKAGYVHCLKKCVLHFKSIHGELVDWVLNCFLSLSLTSSELSRFVLSSPGLINTYGLSAKLSNILYRLSPCSISKISADSIYVYIKHVNGFKESVLPFLFTNKICPKVIAVLTDYKLSACLTVDWLIMSNIEPDKIIVMFHYDNFLNQERLHVYLIHLVDELFSRLANDDAKRIMFDVLCCCKAAYPDKKTNLSLSFSIENLNRWKYKQLIRMLFFKRTNSLSSLFINTRVENYVS